MKPVWIIAKRELATFFDSLIAYVILALFLGLSGFFTWLYGTDIFFLGQADLKTFFAIGSWTLFFFIPAITMKMLAEEKKTGTLELLLTKNITDRQLVVGKFLGSIILIVIALVATFPYIITLLSIGDLDVGSTLCGYLGLLLMSVVYTSIGIFTSSITNNQIIAFILALFVSLFFHIIFGVIAAQFTGIIGQIFSTLNLQEHFESISRGVIDSKDLVYFISIGLLGLLMAEKSLSKRHIAN